MTKQLRCAASSLIIRRTPVGDDSQARALIGEVVTAHGESYDRKWTFIVADGGAGWASSEFLVPTDVHVSPAPLRIIPRSAWGSLHPPAVAMRPGPKKLVVVHHFATPDVPAEASEEQERVAMLGVERYHTAPKPDGNGWKAIGYSFVIFASGRVYEGRGWGMVGAHTPGRNSSAHGICFGINGAKHALTDAAIWSFRYLVADGIRHGHVTADWDIGGHRDFDDTRCPGDKIYAQFGRLRA